VNGRVVVVSGPSGSGKNAVLEALEKRVARAVRATTATTRMPRAGEVDGRDYWFLPPETFSAREQRGAFLETAEVHGNRYGTPRDEVERLVRAGHIVLLQIDVQGARSLRNSGLDLVSVFLMPPSMEELERRLRARATDAPGVIEQRLRNARAEVAVRGEFDYTVVNDDLDRAVNEIVQRVIGSPAPSADSPEPNGEQESQ
jgi:guanylate kinase